MNMQSAKDIVSTLLWMVASFITITLKLDYFLQVIIAIDSFYLVLFCVALLLARNLTTNYLSNQYTSQSNVTEIYDLYEEKHFILRSIQQKRGSMHWRYTAVAGNGEQAVEEWQDISFSFTFLLQNEYMQSTIDILSTSL